MAVLMSVFVSTVLLGTGTFASDKMSEIAAESSEARMTAKSPNQIMASSDYSEFASNPTGGKGLGDLGKPPDYDQTIKCFSRIIPNFDTYVDTALPSSWNWNTQGKVTVAKDQGTCGSCWAFATAGALESKILIAGGPTYDLSEQELVSCACQYGCCGGYSYALRHWYTQGPMQESCAGYVDSGWSGACSPPGLQDSSLACGSLPSCSRLSYYTMGYYTVDMSNANEIKTSLYNDGPTYFRYDVYTDFSDGVGGGWWNTASAGAVYTNTSGTKRGGHAVLIIGWDDSKSAWLCKNSWGASAGPEGDGTFWIAYSGHTNDLQFGMANVQISKTRQSWCQCNDLSGSGVVSNYMTDKSKGVYSADDFTTTRRWSINTIFTEGFISPSGTLSNASSLNWYIYPDSSGVPAGYPGDGVGNHIWSYTCLPSASEVTISGYGTTLDVTATSSPLNLQPGTYWLCFYPSINTTTYGSYYWFRSCSQNPQRAHLIDPTDYYGGGYTSWTSWYTVFGDTDYYDATFYLEGTVAVGGFNPGIGLLLLGD